MCQGGGGGQGSPPSLRCPQPAPVRHSQGKEARRHRWERGQGTRAWSCGVCEGQETQPPCCHTRGARQPGDTCPGTPGDPAHCTPRWAGSRLGAPSTPSTAGLHPEAVPPGAPGAGGRWGRPSPRCRRALCGEERGAPALPGTGPSAAGEAGPRRTEPGHAALPCPQPDRAAGPPSTGVRGHRERGKVIQRGGWRWSRVPSIRRSCCCLLYP